MTNIELKQALYEVFKKHRDLGSMSTQFKQGLNQYYTSPNPESYINRMKYYVGLFDQGKGDERYIDFINEIREVFKKAEVGDSNAEQTVGTKSEVISVESKDESKSDNKVETEKKTESVKIEVKSESVKSQKPQPRIPTENKFKSDKEDYDYKPDKPQPQKKQHIEPIVKSKRTGKYSIVDMSQKSIRLTLSNGLIDLFDKHMGEAGKNYLIGSGKLTDVEANALASDTGNVSATYRNHDFNLTRNDLFTILILLGLTHLNVDLKDDTVSELFDYNELKIDFYQQLMNTNLVELDVQSRVRELQKKLEKSVGQNERIETMLGFLLLERANVPKNQNRETVKKALDTSSVMNQAPDSFSVLDGIIGSKISSIKDYKRVRGE